jgi:hypothetical protein
MRIAVALLACLGASALTSALADPQTEAQSGPEQSSAPAAPAPAAPAPAAAASSSDAAAASAAPATKAATAKPELDKDTQHFLAEGYKPEMRGGEQIYCRRETALGSRLTPVKNCGTIEQLKLAEQQTKSGVYDAQRQQINPTVH